MKINKVLVSTVLSVFVMGTAALAGMPEMGPGESGEWERALQMRLRTVGVGETAEDGEYGDDTYELVKKFQEMVGLTADGYVGEQTVNSLYQDVVYYVLDGNEYTFKLIPPFETITIRDNKTVVYTHGDIECTVDVAEWSSVDEAAAFFAGKAEDLRLKVENNGFITSNNQLVTENIDVNGHTIAVVKQSYEYTKDGVNMSTYRWYTIMPATSSKVFVARLAFSLPYETAESYLSSIYAENPGVNICETLQGGLYSDTPGLVNVDGELLGEDATLTDILQVIMQYVDESDETSDEGLYYGARLAQLYRGFGNLEDPELRKSTVEMAAMLLTFDHPELYEQKETFKAKVLSCISALEREDAQVRLADMGITDIEAGDIENLRAEAVDWIMAGIDQGAEQGAGQGDSQG